MMVAGFAKKIASPLVSEDVKGNRLHVLSSGTIALLCIGLISTPKVRSGYQPFSAHFRGRVIVSLGISLEPMTANSFVRLCTHWVHNRSPKFFRVAITSSSGRRHKRPSSGDFYAVFVRRRLVGVVTMAILKGNSTEYARVYTLHS